jgi:negative regulator of flagellin synthesis FlgM
MNIERSLFQRAGEVYMSGGQHNVNASSGTNASQGAKGAGDSSASAAAAGADATVSLSPGAQIFARALAAAQSTPEVRADRVAALRARIAQGGGEVDVNALAQKLMGTVEH